MSPKPTVLITGASSGIGATYADRFAKRGHNLALVARTKERLDALATRLHTETGVTVDVLQADLANSTDLATVEARLRDDASIGILVNNAGIALSGNFAEQSTDDIARLVSINSVAVIRLAHVAARKFVGKGEGAIINIGSVVGLVPEFNQAAYAASKAFVQLLSQSMNLELAPKGVYVQGVLPAGTQTEIWERSGSDLSKLPALMDVKHLVDAALAGFDQREPITIPPLHDAGKWTAFQAARQAMLPEFGNTVPADRYLETV